MVEFILALLAALRVFFRSRGHTALEILALRQQVAVLNRKRPRLPEGNRSESQTHQLPGFGVRLKVAEQGVGERVSDSVGIAAGIEGDAAVVVGAAVLVFAVADYRCVRLNARISFRRWCMLALRPLTCGSVARLRNSRGSFS